MTKHMLDIMTSSPIKWRERPNMTIAVDWDAKPQLNSNKQTNKQTNIVQHNMSRLMGKPTICKCENKCADQLRGNHEADQRLCIRYTDSTIPLLPKYEISCF